MSGSAGLTPAGALAPVEVTVSRRLSGEARALAGGAAPPGMEMAIDRAEFYTPELDRTVRR